MSAATTFVTVNETWYIIQIRRHWDSSMSIKIQELLSSTTLLYNVLIPEI